MYVVFLTYQSYKLLTQTEPEPQPNWAAPNTQSDPSELNGSVVFQWTTACD